MPFAVRFASASLALGAIAVSSARAQESLGDLMARHGVSLPAGSLERAFDEGLTPAAPVRAGSLATPLAVLTSATGTAQIDAAYAFGILAGRSGRGVSPQELAAARQSLTQMIGSADRRSRIAGARVAGRVFAAPFEGRPAAATPELLEALFALWNQSHEIEQLAAMDALGLLRVPTAVTSLTERYRFYRDTRRRALAGGALEALARIGDPSSVAIVRVVTTDAWGSGRDATALAVAFARERLLKDGSVAYIRQAADDRALRVQALGYLAELGVALP
jgi:hypothetical protein